MNKKTIIQPSQGADRSAETLCGQDPDRTYDDRQQRSSQNRGAGEHPEDHGRGAGRKAGRGGRRGADSPLDG